MAGTCASPDGTDTQIGAPPPDYAWLLANGYCYAVSPAVKNFVACYTLTSPGTSVDFNAGYATTGCTGLLINYAELYTSTPGCVLIDGTAIGVTTGLTAGGAYTWCISLKCTGPGPGFTSFCPYYQDVTPLYVELLSFECYYNKYTTLKWKTAAEFNSDYFIIDCSNDMINWIKGQTIKSSNSTIGSNYEVSIFEDFEYYRLFEVDYNGVVTLLSTIACNNGNHGSLESIWELYDAPMNLVCTGNGEFIKSNVIASGVYILKQNNKYFKIFKP